MKALVPSIGSSTQTYSASGFLVIRKFLAHDPVRGKRVASIMLTHGGFGGAVGFRHRIEHGAAFVLVLAWR